MPSFLGNPPFYTGFSWPFPKNQIYQWTPENESFLSLTQSYLLKVTKFLAQISQSEFLVMTETNIFVYQLFCH